MNLGEVKQKTTIYIREYSNNNALIGAIQNGDYLLSIPFLADSAQKEIAMIKKIPDVYYISQYPTTNQLGLFQGYNIVQFLGTDIINTQAVGSKSYYFEVDNVATIYIEEEINGVWTILETLTSTTKKRYTAFKGLINASNGSNAIRIRFSGTSPYNIRNRALFAYTYPLASDVPDYKPFQEYTLPSNFYELDKIMVTAENRQRVPYIGGQWRNRNTYILNYHEKGEFEIHYWRYPNSIPNNAADDFELDIDTEAQELIPLYCAGHVVKDEDLSISVTMLNEYEKRLSRLANSDIYQVSQVSNVTGW
jgi:hypothetical protein